MYKFKTKGVCSAEIRLDIKDGIIREVEFLGGCDGNLKGIGKLVKGRKALEVAQMLKGTRCGYKNTSCPDQLSLAIEEALKLEEVRS